MVARHIGCLPNIFDVQKEMLVGLMFEPSSKFMWFYKLFTNATEAKGQLQCGTVAQRHIAHVKAH